jgi:hypothetical protein
VFTPGSHRATVNPWDPSECSLSMLVSKWATPEAGLVRMGKILLYVSHGKDSDHDLWLKSSSTYVVLVPDNDCGYRVLLGASGSSWKQGVVSAQVAPGLLCQ